MSWRPALFASALVVAAACSPGRVPHTEVPATPSGFGRGRVTFTQGNATLSLEVEVASTPTQRERGLMGRTSVPAGTGMLFTYPDAEAWGGYWMKDTLVPLDIAWIRAGTVFEVDHMVPCRVAECPVTIPRGSFDSVVEAAAGTFAAARIGPGASAAVAND